MQTKQTNLFNLPHAKVATFIGGSEFKIMRLNESPADAPLLDNPQRLVDYLRPQLAESLTYRPDVENFIVVQLNTRKRAIGFEVISQGTLDTILVAPREVFKSAIIANSAAIALVHNHPSGDAGPSDADIKVTRDLIRAGQLLKIEVVDHVILGQNRHSSLRELGFFYTT